MTGTHAETLSVVVERELPHPLEKVWRALTQPHLIAEWLMQTDFQPLVGHRFKASADWGGIDCQVKAVEPNKRLTYAWDTKDLTSIITWDLTPTSEGVRLRMEQTGFRPDQQPYFRGAKVGWPRFFDNLEQVLARTD
jgi:uncharacterized protein YndB with AHSA1/START domain